MAIIITLLGLKNLPEPRRGADYELLDLLRVLAGKGLDVVIRRDWALAELDVDFYGGGGYSPGVFEEIFPEVGPNPPKTIKVTGERLMERSALITRVEEGLFCRCIDGSLPVEFVEDLHIEHGPHAFQATNIDLEIRRSEVLPYEVVTEDESLVAHLERWFAYTETSRG